MKTSFPSPPPASPVPFPDTYQCYQFLVRSSDYIYQANRGLFTQMLYTFICTLLYLNSMKLIILVSSTFGIAAPKGVCYIT